MSESSIFFGFVTTKVICVRIQYLSGFVTPEVMCVRIQCPLWLYCIRGDMCQNPVSSLGLFYQRCIIHHIQWWIVSDCSFVSHSINIRHLQWWQLSYFTFTSLNGDECQNPVPSVIELVFVTFNGGNWQNLLSVVMNLRIQFLQL